MRRRRAGLSLLEVLVVVGILGVALGIGFSNLRPLAGDLHNNANRVAGTFRQVRAKAMVTTSAYRVVKLSATRLRAEYAVTCSAASWTADPKLGIDLGDRTEIRTPAANTGLVCFNSRGLAEDNPTLVLADPAGKTVSVEVFLGGAVEIR